MINSSTRIKKLLAAEINKFKNDNSEKEAAGSIC